MQRSWKRVQSFIKVDHLWWGIILLGVFLRLYQYLLNRSFWEDEASLALNIVNRSYGELTTLLDYHQAAPIGFLYIEKLLIRVLGNQDYVLRLFPLFAGILAVYIIYRLAREHIGVAGLFSVTLFATSWWLIYYSSELKQYSSDVLIALLLVFLAGKCIREDAQSKDFFLLGIVGFIAIWVSHPSVFTLAGIGLVLVLEKFTRKEYASWIWILSIVTGWLASFGLEYLLSLRHIVTDAYLIEYWKKAYLPSPPWSNSAWYINTYYYFLFYVFYRADNLMALITLVLTSVGALSLMIKNWKVALLIASPLVMTVIASALHRYPLKGRFILFFVPFLLLFMAESFRGIYWLAAKWNRKFAAVFSGILVLVVVSQVVPSNYERAISNNKDDIRPILHYVVENKQPDDLVYVFHRTKTVVNYYATFYELDTGNITFGNLGSTKRKTLQSFQDDVNSLVGNQRVWFIFSEVFDCPNCSEENTLSFYLNYINKFGTLIDSFNGSGANAYLYDLSP